MNIFAVSLSPSICAASLDDKRVIKMALESAQMLCTSLYSSGFRDVPYKPTHIKHPCNLWAAKNVANWEWLHRYLHELNSEYRKRFKEIDLKAYSVVMDHDLLASARAVLPEGEMTEFHNSSGFPELPVYEAYKESLKRKWLVTDKRKPRWTKSHPPEWCPAF